MDDARCAFRGFGRHGRCLAMALPDGRMCAEHQVLFDRYRREFQDASKGRKQAIARSAAVRRGKTKAPALYPAVDDDGDSDEYD